MSNSYDYLDHPNVEDAVDDPVDLEEAIAALNLLENSFVHLHWLAVDVRDDGKSGKSEAVLLVSGEHTDMSV